MSDSKSSSGGIGFFGLLTIAFVVLKLCNVIAWSWWWVTCPLWGPVALLMIGLLIYLPFWLYKKKDAHSRIKAGYSEYGWNNGGKSKWQQRMEEMQKKQKSDAN